MPRPSKHPGADVIRADFHAGLDDDAMAARYGVSAARVKVWRCELALLRPHPQRPNGWHVVNQVGPTTPPQKPRGHLMTEAAIAALYAGRRYDAWRLPPGPIMRDRPATHVHQQSGVA
jgi:hypothetical protein